MKDIDKTLALRASKVAKGSLCNKSASMNTLWVGFEPKPNQLNTLAQKLHMQFVQHTEVVGVGTNCICVGNTTRFFFG